MKSTLLILGALSFATLAHAADEDLIDADRPGIADGSHTVKRGAFQFEFGPQTQRDDGVRTFSTPTLLRYGLTERFEARVESEGYQRSRGQSSWAPVSAGFKYHFLDTPSTGVIARVFQRGTADVRLASDINVGEKWSINPNAGLVSQKDGERFTAALAALTVQYNFSDVSNGFVDGGYQSREDRNGGASLIVDTGAAWITGRNTQFDVSAGWGIRGSTSFFVSAGVSHRY